MNGPLRILIVDDDPNMARTLCDILAVSGFQGETARNAEDGLGKLARESYQVVISDIRMAGMNGVEFQKIIKQEYPEVHMILMTAYADYELIARGRQQGAMAFLEKPLNIPLLLSILRVVSDGPFGTTGAMPGMFAAENGQ